jgi:hypothetical protein
MNFDDRCSCSNPIELHKRVLYSHGLVLGVGELKTEQNFMLGHHRGHNRRLHGYGTGAGLQLEIRDVPDGPECIVHPGWGVDAQGHDICVHDAQCAKLNQWLQQQQQGDLSSVLDTSGTASVEAYVVLCYRECETDKVPIPVGPCLSLDKAMVASRIEESFELQLRAEAPAQVEEDAIRRFGDILARVSIASSPGGLTTPDALVAEIRALADGESPPASIPSIPVDLVLDPAHAEEILQAGLRVFVTEVRPNLVPDGGPCLNGPRGEACLLLGRLVFDVTTGLAGPKVASNSVVIDESRRPLLLATRLLQEAMLSKAFGSLDAGATIWLPPSVARVGAQAGNSEIAGRPTIRFRRNGTVTFSFGLPADVPNNASARLRLHWAVRKGGAIPISWDASLLLQSPNSTLSDFTAPAVQASIAAAIPTASNDRLLTTDFVVLKPNPTPDPVVGFLRLTLTSGAALPADFEVHFILAELAVDAGGKS